MASTGDQRGYHLLAEEQLSAGDDAFLQTIRELTEPKALAGLTDRWKNDPRPWARKLMRQYALLPFDKPGHQVVVKRLYKQAEARGDDELIGCFAMAFDRLVRRRRRLRHEYDRSSRSVVESEVLTTPGNVIRSKPVTARDPYTGKMVTYHQRITPAMRLFRYRTRYYLQRRAWRWLRKLGYTDAGRYLKAVGPMLESWSDADLSVGEHLIDSWSLIHVLHGESQAIEFTSLRATLKEGRTLADVKAAPAFSKHWRSQSGEQTALQVLINTQSGLVRSWALALHRDLATTFPPSIPVETLLGMLAHANEEVQAYGALLLNNAPEAANWPLETWMKLLKCDSPNVAQLLCEAMLRHVSTERLSVEQCVEIASAKAVPISRMGLRFLQQKQPMSADDLPKLVALAKAASISVGHDISTWALNQIGTADRYRMDEVCRFFDSGSASIRVGAWEWLNQPACPAWADASLWSRLSETPYEDVRLRMVDALSRRADVPQMSPADLVPVWSAVLLNVNRGGRQKLRALKQVAEALTTYAEHRQILLPVLVTTVRSIRGPEARSALSSVMTVLARHPELEAEVVAVLPELNLHPLEAAA